MERRDACIVEAFETSKLGWNNGGSSSASISICVGRGCFQEVAFVLGGFWRWGTDNLVFIGRRGLLICWHDQQKGWMAYYSGKEHLFCMEKGFWLREKNQFYGAESGWICHLQLGRGKAPLMGGKGMMRYLSAREN